MKSSHIVLSVLILLLLNCYAPFSPERGRLEIERQTGAKLEDSFEFKLDGATMKLLKAVASNASDEDIDFWGVDRIDLAVYSLPSNKRIDFKKIGRRGWDTLVEKKSKNGDLMVLVRTNGKNLADMVVMAQGEEKVLYGRLKGKFSPEISGNIQETFNEKGIEGLKDKLTVPFKKE
ncbi:MAG: DUF4252 domain-containing protein [Acidobacteria bacterium]|nr:DUF4252 domain-containing protein [Acidobacteriota bacterium]